MTEGDFFSRLATAEGRIRSGIPPKTTPELIESLGEFGTKDTVRAWGHAHDLGIFVGSDKDHNQNPIIVAICETRSGSSIYRQMAQAKCAWEFYEKMTREIQPGINKDPRG